MLNNDLILLGKRIKEIRSNNNLSQERLSELCGISSRHISEIERGVSNPSYQVLNQIALALQIPVSTLFEFAHHKNEDELRNDIISIVKTLPPSKLRFVYRMISVLNN